MQIQLSGCQAHFPNKSITRFRPFNTELFLAHSVDYECQKNYLFPFTSISSIDEFLDIRKIQETLARVVW